MNKNTYWIRVHTAYLDDPKFMKLANETKWIYFGLYLLAKKADAGGIIGFNDYAFSIEDIAFALHDSLENISKSISSLIETGYIIHDKNIYSIVDYEENQDITQTGDIAEKKREQTRKRVNRHREKIRKEKESEEENRERITEEEKEIEIEKEGNALHVTPVTRYTSVTPVTSSSASLSNSKSENATFSSKGSERSDQYENPDLPFDNTFSLESNQDNATYSSTWDIDNLLKWNDSYTVKFIQDASLKDVNYAIKKFGFVYLQDILDHVPTSIKYDADTRLKSSLNYTP